MKPLVIYDGECGICAGNLPWLYRLDWLKKFDALPYQAEEIYTQYPNLTRVQCEEAIQLVFSNARVYGGADALRHIFMRMPLVAPIGVLASIPPLPWLLRKLYAVIARNRYRLGGHCKLPTEKTETRRIP